MLDIRFIRDNKDLIKEAAKKKRVDFDIDELLSLDEKRRMLLQSVEEKRAEQNRTSNSIMRFHDEVKRQEFVQEMRALKAGMQEDEEKLREVMKKWQELMLLVPNIPDISVPDGESEADNVTLKEWGNKPEFPFNPKNHIELMEKHNMVDFERGSKVHGFRGYFLKNDGALLSWAIWNYANKFFLDKGFNPFIAPTIVKKEFFYGTGHLPGDGNDLYRTQDDDYLSGTAEVPMMAYHSEEILKKEDLPIKYLAFSLCFRREAGSHGKDTKGLMRVHEFYKLEQLILCEASHAESEKLHEEINRNTEEFIESLEIPYRQLAISTGDLKAAHVKSYDTELWIPSENAYREIASASYYHDFQARRFNIRYDNSGVKTYVHSLNGTAIPTPRVLIALVENYQNPDGTIRVPEKLVPYLGKTVIGSPEEQNIPEKDEVI